MKKAYIVMLSFALLLALTSCGQHASGNGAEESESVQAVYEESYWTEQRWIHNGEIGSVSMHPLYL